MEQQKKVRKTVQRSPNYPAFGLQEAVNKIRVLWDRDGKAGAPEEIALEHLGYSSQKKSGPALRALSTLKKFDLIIEKDKRILLSQLALDLVLYAQTDERYIKALQSSALRPNIYNVLYNKYRDGFPSDASLKAELIRDFNFNKNSVDNFLEGFRQTIEFANLKGEIIQTEVPQEENRLKETGLIKEQFQAIRNVVTPKSVSTYNIPLKNKKTATLSFDNYPAREDLKLLRKWIEILELALPDNEEDNLTS